MNRRSSASGGRGPASDKREPRPTLADVAARAGVSPSTASLAFSGQGPVADATRERVLAAATELDYAGPDPRAQSLRRGRSGIVGALMPSRIGVSFRDPVLIQTLDGLAEQLSSIGAGLLLMTEADDDQVTIANAPVDAVVLVGCNANPSSTLGVLSRRGIPMVSIEGPAIEGSPAIGVDNRGGTRELAEHLRELGHSRVALVTLGLTSERRSGPLAAALEAAANVPTTIERIAGAREVFPSISGWVAGSSRVDAGRRAALALLDVPEPERPTAIIAQSDLLAAGVIRAAEELGLTVPRDLSVVGFDGIRVDNLSVNLTTMWQPAQQKGSAAGRAVIALLEGRMPEPECFGVRFERGETTAPPRIP